MNLISLIALQLEKEGTTYHFFVPSGSSYSAAKEVLDEMKQEIERIEKEVQEREKEQKVEGGE